MINVAIIAGGPSAERGVSLKSAQTIARHLPTEKYLSTIIDITSQGWIDTSSGARMDLNHFGISDSSGVVIKKFDFAFVIIHGTPAEDGKLQGYLEMMDVPHSACSVLTSALTFNKQMCKDHLRGYNIPMAESMITNTIIDKEIVVQHNITLPCFVKPNNNGSSYGVTKVKEWAQLPAAIAHALTYDHEVMIERALQGGEYSCGVVREGSNYHVLPITEIIPEGEFFDFAAKYEGHSQEITPARLEEHVAIKCQETTKRLYRLLGCRGMVRFDYILEGDTFYLLEANTTPGMSEASIIPQQAKAYGWSVAKLLDVVVTDCMANPH